MTDRTAPTPHHTLCEIGVRVQPEATAEYLVGVQLGLQFANERPDLAKVLLASCQSFHAKSMGLALEEVGKRDRVEARGYLHIIFPTEEPAPTEEMFDRATCRSCNAPIYWIVTTKGKRAPMNLDPATNTPLDPPVNHFVTCPDSKGWKKGR
jgi:hypothetical protein